MLENTDNGGLARALTIGLAVNAAWAIMLFAVRRLRDRLAARHVRVSAGLFWAVWLGWFVVSEVWLFLFWDDPELAWLGPSITAVLLLIWNWGATKSLLEVGIRGADRQISSGLDYAKALRSCRRELSFLGTGAAKLTSNDECEAALTRCRPDRPIRFLLMNPTDEALADAALRFGKPEDEYAAIVRRSLQALARFARRFPNIEVRFYRKPQVLRLMFLDNCVCLASHNTYGHGDGSNLPQLHLAKAPREIPVHQSFYYPLEQYFDQLWNTATRWNPRDWEDGSA